jgi:hypothetical protein
MLEPTTDNQDLAATDRPARWFGLADAKRAAEPLRMQVVRELHRETWLVENTGDIVAEVLPIERSNDRSIRRVQVNGEAARFESYEDALAVVPPTPLAPGAGTTVIVQFR